MHLTIGNNILVQGQTLTSGHRLSVKLVYKYVLSYAIILHNSQTEMTNKVHIEQGLSGILALPEWKKVY